MLNVNIINKYKSYILVNDYNSFCKELRLKENNVYLGQFILGEDGIWEFYPAAMGGAFPDYSLIGIGFILFDLNYLNSSK